MQPYLECLYKTMFYLSYYGMLRVGEVTDSPHVLKAADIHFGDKRDYWLLLVLYSSKIHGVESEPQKIKISAGMTKQEGSKSIKQKHTNFFLSY